MEKTIAIKSKGADLVDFMRLKPFQGELKSLSNKNFEKLKSSILKNGFTAPIHVWKGPNGEFNMIDGHQRYRVLTKLKMDGYSIPPVPIDFIESDSFKDAKRVLLTHASSYGTIANENLYEYLIESEIRPEEIVESAHYQEVDEDKFLAEFFKDTQGRGKTDEDDVPDNVESVCKLGDVWTLGSHRLLCGDATKIEAVDKLMDGEKADMIFTDPPYGISIVKNQSVGVNGRIGFVGAENAPAQLAKARAYKAIVGDDVAFDPSFILSLDIETVILWGANHYASKLPDRPQWLIWDKKLESGTLDHNNFSDCELAWTNSTALSAKIYRHTWAGMLRVGARKEELKDRVHPTQKPVGLCEAILNDYKHNSVLDTFGGSGSTLIACEKTNRKCYMMELDPHYCDVIIKRWEDYTDQKAVKS